MPTNAQRRRAAKPAKVLTFRRNAETKTIERLRAALAQVQTRAQLEEMIRAAHPDHRVAVRELYERLAPAGLPCCGKAMLARAQRKPCTDHHTLCPVAGRVVLTN